MQPDNLADANAKAAPVHRVLSALLAAGFALEIVNVCAPLKFSGWLEAVLLLLAMVNTISALSRQLPLQNVLLAAFGIALIGGGVSLAGAKTGIPFGPVTYEIAPEFYKMPWAMPFLWVAVVLNSRGVARLVLRPWRKVRVYGFWLIGFTAAFTVAFDFALESFARVKHLWLWMAAGVPVAWQGAPASNFVAWAAVTLLILAFVTPALINKQLSKRSTPDFHPLLLWLGAILVFAVACAVQKLWLAAAVDAAIGVVIAAFAVRGAKW